MLMREHMVHFKDNKGHTYLRVLKQPMKLAMLIPWILLLLLSYGDGIINCAARDGNDTDLVSLLVFKRAITNDPTGALSSWNATIHFCRWKGVACSRTPPERVVTLDLAGQTLAGQISPSLGNMSFLASLNLSTNKFSGQIPRLGHLHELKFLDLSYNSLQGIIPVTLTNCSNLRTLDLSRNLLVGEIPAEIAHLTNLTRLRLHYNILTGIIPPDLGNITSLEHIILLYNQLEGSIPDELGKLSKMSYLLLDQNKLSGRVPEALFNLSSLIEMSLPLNMLVGALPSYIGDTLPNLQYLLLGGNMLDGHVPASLGSASELQTIDLSFNGFTGQIPPSLGKLRKLNWLGLDTNNLEANDSGSWGFLDALSNCSLLQEFSLHGNLLQGLLPISVGNLSSSLNVLLFGSNMLSGFVPSSIGNLRSLIKLGLDDNYFTGTIDGWMGKLLNLQSLLIQSNNFTEHIPPSIGNLTNLSFLNLSNNQFDSPIPSSLGSLPRLSQLDLSYNSLQGSIPKEIFTVVTMIECVLSHNNLEGVVPEIGNLQQLTKVDISANKLTGEIPATLSTCLQLEIIQMDQNLLSGSIPINLGNLISLSMLNLSHNSLSGNIPAALSDLRLLSKLDLSDNHLEGDIPRNGVFKNATGISLRGNRGLCGGVLDLHMPSCPTISQSRTGLPRYLVRVLIPIVGFVLFTLLIYLILHRKKTLRKQLSLPFLGEQFPKVSYKDLAQATEKFAESNLIGRGSYGSVYKGKLIQANMVVAVKVFDLDMRGADRSFMSECKALRSIRHRNLLPILTACSTIDNTGNDFKALVYEFMPNGNLDTWLHPIGNSNAPNLLDLTQRTSIAADIADVLQYLHHDCERPIIHCDLKPSNILLDDGMTAHLGDFGIARFHVTSRSSSIGDPSSTGLKGTIGYIAPEYAGGNYVSTFGDVYGFGVLLLEMLTGKRPTDPMFCNGLSIVNFIERNYPYDIIHILDTYLQQEYREFARTNLEEERALYQCLLNLLEVALSCVREVPSERLTMIESAAKLHAIKRSYKSWMES